jgi:TonB family protein
MAVSRASAQEVTRKSLNGTWRWVATRYGGLSIGGSTPEACGCERFLTFKPDASYEFVEQDSAHEYVLTHGAIQVHWVPAQELARTPGAWSWLSLEHGLQVGGHREDKSFRFYGPDTLRFITSDSGEIPTDAGSDRFVRDGGPNRRYAPALRMKRLPLTERPPRESSDELPSGDQLPEEREFVHYEDPPIPVTQVRPIYPESAREAKIEGTVLLHVLVGVDGRVKNIRVTRSVTGLSEAAVDAVKKWVFKPAISNNKPVAVWVEIPFHFPP